MPNRARIYSPRLLNVGFAPAFIGLLNSSAVQLIEDFVVRIKGVRMNYIIILFKFISLPQTASDKTYQPLTGRTYNNDHINETPVCIH